MFGNSINDLFTKGLDWQTGSTLALFLLLVVAGLMVVFGGTSRSVGGAMNEMAHLAEHAQDADRRSSRSWCCSSTRRS